MSLANLTGPVFAMHPEDQQVVRWPGHQGNQVVRYPEERQNGNGQPQGLPQQRNQIVDHNVLMQYVNSLQIRINQLSDTKLNDYSNLQSINLEGRKQMRSEKIIFLRQTRSFKNELNDNCPIISQPQFFRDREIQIRTLEEEKRQIMNRIFPQVEDNQGGPQGH
jgi:hypothetical protein